MDKQAIVGIYKITSPNGKVYVGQSNNIKKRFGFYKRLSCKFQTLLYRSLVKYGVDSHMFDVLELCDVQQLNEKERYYQDLYQAVGKNGLNLILTSTSDKKMVLSEETKLKISKSSIGRKHTEEAKDKIRKSLIGKPSRNKGHRHSDEYRKILATRFLGKTHTEEARKIISEKAKKRKCASLDEKGIIIKTFNSLKEASENYNVFISNINKAIKYKRKSGGVKWMYI